MDSGDGSEINDRRQIIRHNLENPESENDGSLNPLLSQNNPGSNHQYSLDDLFQTVGFGKYQWRLLLNMCWVAFAEGVQMIVTTLCLTITQNQWKYDSFTASLLASSLFIGVVLGAGTCGYFADKHGRQKPIMWSIGLMTLTNFFAAFAWNTTTFAISRTILGFLMGFFAPLGFTMVTENVPKDKRGQIVMVAQGALFLGQLSACLLAYFVAKNLENGNWQALTLWSTIFFLIPMVLNYLYLDESIRYALVMRNFEQSFQIIDKMLKLNGKQELTQQQKIGLESWAIDLSNQFKDQESASIKALFSHGYKKTTVIIWLGWFINSFVFYGIALLLPITLSKLSAKSVSPAPDAKKLDPLNVTNQQQGKSDLGSLTISTLIESISIVIALFFIGAQAVGRKESLVLFYIITGAAALATVFDVSRGAFVLWATITKIFINVCSFYFYLYTTEVYPTKIRATGIGIAASVGKLGAIVMPWICIFLMQFDLLLPFLLFSIISWVMAIFVIKLPMDTKGIELK